MPSDLRWLEPAHIIELNKLVVEQTGEPFFLRDEGLLESACGRPANLHHYEGEEDVVTLALALLWGIARNHPFEQGNKRVAFEAAVMFLEINGYDLVVADTEVLAWIMVAVIAHEYKESAFEDYIRPFVTPL